MADSEEQVTFSVQLQLPIADVQSKIRNKAQVLSTGFLSKDDPRPIEFQVSAKFGSEEPDYLSAYFKSKGEAVEVKRLRITVVDVAGGRLLASFESEGGKNPVTSWGWSEMLSLNEITTSKIVILCNLEYQTVKKQTTPSERDQFQSRLASDLSDLLQSSAFADVKFQVQGEEIPAHKSILVSRSTYFDKMFNAGMQESESGRVEITDVEPTTFKAVLRYLYGSVLEEKEFEPLAKLIAAADKYGIDELKEICASALSTNLQVQDVIDALLLADLHNCQGLLRAAKTLFKAHSATVKEDQIKWKKLVERPSLVLQLLECAID